MPHPSSSQAPVLFTGCSSMHPGFIANYRCPAACGHCLYGCAPAAEAGYVTEETARHVCAHLRRLGCRGLHIGGGEPFLNLDGLLGLIRVIRESGIEIEYIETNAAWVTSDAARNRDILARVTDAGGGCIMVSADPFHVGYIPFWKPRTLIGLLEDLRIPHFIWQERYLPLLCKLDETRTYDGEALREVFGYDVLGRAAHEYGMGFNGRALNLLRPVAKKQRAEAFLNRTPCKGLFSSGHSHVDYLGRHIPPGCTGMGVLIEDIDKPLDPQRNPVVTRLAGGGTEALFAYACEKGYMEAPEGYVSVCDLCFQTRQYLSLNHPKDHPDLTPPSFYRQDY